MLDISQYDINDNQKCDLLERILRSYCPNDGKSYKFIDKMTLDKNIKPLDFVIALADGLKYGNWPWTNYSKPKSEHSRTCDLVGYRQGYNAPPVCSCGVDK